MAFLNEWLDVDLTPGPGQCHPDRRGADPCLADTLIWDGERLFQAAKFGTEMQYQHLVFEEFARKIQPNINVFVVPDGYRRHDRSVDRRRVRPRGLSLRPLDADRDDRPLRPDLHRRPDRPDRGLPQSDRVRRRPRHRRRRRRRRHHPRHDPPGRQRDRRVRHQRAAQQPARPAARPRDHQPGPRPRHRRAVAERGARASSIEATNQRRGTASPTRAGSTSPATSRTRPRSSTSSRPTARTR